jgi:tetratricopeptide (TPR) repeat protein
MSSTAELLDKARSLRQQGENQKALETYRQVIEADNSNLDALNEMGLVHNLIGEQALAINAFDLAICIDPSDSRAYSHKAEAFLTLSDFDEALAAAEQGLDQAPEDPELWAKKARALESVMRIDDAIAAYQESIKYDSENPKTWKALALCLDAQEKWTEVARAYRIAGALHEKRGESQDAESCFKFAEFAEKS